MVQSEYYTTEGESGTLETDRRAITDENPEFVVFKGAVGSHPRRHHRDVDERRPADAPHGDRAMVIVEG